MPTHGSHTQPPDRGDPATPNIRPRKGERRKVRSPGLTYISTVGWICRRECCRRCDDQMDDGYPECSIDGGVDEHS